MIIHKEINGLELMFNSDELTVEISIDDHNCRCQRELDASEIGELIEFLIDSLSTEN